MITRPIEYTIILFLAMFFTVISYAIYYNIADSGKYMRTIGIPLSIISVLFNVLLVTYDFLAGVILLVFASAVLALIVAQNNAIRKKEQEGLIKTIHLIPGNFNFVEKQYTSLIKYSFLFLYPTTNVEENSTVISVKGENDPIMMLMPISLDKKGEYELRCLHVQKEGDKPYWYCTEARVIRRPFSLKRAVSRLFGFFVLLAGLISVSVQAGVNVMGLQIDPYTFEYIEQFFGCACGIGIFYAGKKIFRQSIIGRTFFTILFYICVACFVLCLI